MLLKFDVYFFIAFAIQFLVLVLRTNDPEFGLTIFAILISPLIVYIVFYAVSFLSLYPKLTPFSIS